MRRTLKNLSVFLALAIGLISCLPAGALAEGPSRSGSVAVDRAHFPDEAFRAWLLDSANLGGAGADGLLSEEELAAVTRMDLSRQGIASLEGIGYFQALEVLDCGTNQLTQLDLSANSRLRELYCSNNLLTRLDLSGNPALEYLYCASNRIEALELRRCPALRDLNCEKNQLSGLDLSGNPALVQLYCRHNQLTQLDVSKNPELVFIETFDNQLTSFDPSPLKKLEFLHIDYNNLSFLDMSQNPALKGNGFVAANNQLDSLVLPDISGFSVEASVFYEQNPREGYDRVQWYWDEAHTRPIGEEEVLEARGQKVYAKWIPNPYTVLYRPNGGQGEMEPQSVCYDQTFRLLPNGFARTGYTFTGWNNYSSGVGGRAFAPEEQVQNLAGKNGSSDKITLYAQWQPVNYTLRYDPNGGEGAVGDTPALYDRAQTLAAGGFTRTDWVLAGWSLTGGENNDRDFFPGQEVKNLAAEEGAVVTLYAVWVSNQEIQQFYLDQLEELGSLYPAENYYPEDGQLREKAYEEARAAIEAAGADETAMSQALQGALGAIQQLPTREERAREVAEGWQVAHKEILDKLGAVIPAEEQDSWKSGARAALGDSLQLNLFSGLAEEESQNQAAARARELLSEELGGLEAMEEALLWLESARDWQEKPLGQVSPEDEAQYAALEADHQALSAQAQGYCDPLILGRITTRRLFAAEKGQALQGLEAAFAALNREDYTPENQAKLDRILEESRRQIREADKIGMADLLLAQARQRLEEVEREQKTPAILEKPTASPLTLGQKLSESKLTGGRAQVEGSFGWKDASLAPTASGSYTVVFTPANTARYRSVELEVTVTVNPPAASPTPTPKPETGSGNAGGSSKPDKAPAGTPAATPAPAAPAPTAAPQATPSGSTGRPTASPTPTLLPARAGDGFWTVSLEAKLNQAEASVEAAALEKAVAQALSQAAGEGMAPAVQIALSRYEGKSLSLNLPAQSLAPLAGQEGAALVLDSRLGWVELDRKVLAAALGRGGETLTLTFRYIPAERLNQAQKEAAGSLPVYEVGLSVDGAALTDWAGGLARVRLGYTPDSGRTGDPRAWQLTEEGEKVLLTSSWDGQAKALEVEAPAPLLFAVGQEEPETAPEPSPAPSGTDAGKGPALPLLAGGAAVLVLLVALALYLKRKNRQED